MHDSRGLVLKYFVLKPHGTDAYAIASRAAMAQYANMIRTIDPVMASQLTYWVNEEQEKAIVNRDDSTEEIST